MDYLTVKEVAELKGCSTQYIQKLCKTGKLQAERHIHLQNKDMCYMIPISALNETLQAKYYKQKRTETGVLPELKMDKTSPKYNLKAVRTPFEEFSAKERETIAFWIELLEEWQSERSKRQNKVEFDKLFVAHQKYIHPNLEISTSILYRKYNAYKNDCLDGLVDGRGKYKHEEKLEFDSVIWQCFAQLYFDDNEPRLSACYRSMVDYIEENYPELVVNIPCEMTFRRKVDKLPVAVVEGIHKGDKYLRDHFTPHAWRLLDKIHANTVWVMDNYTFDIQIKNEEGTTSTKRMHLTGVIDAKSGVLVGWNITDTVDSQSTLIALRNAILVYGIPEYLYFDNGREFATLDIEGVKRNRKISKDKEENLPPTILYRLGINVIVANPRNARAKVIERAHVTFKNQFCRGFIGWCGGNILEKPESLKRHIKNGILETEHELRERFREYINYCYNVQNYGGSEVKYKGMSRIDVWNKSIQDVELRVTTSDSLSLLLMRTEVAQKVRREGVRIKFQGEDIWYYDEYITWQHIGEKVFVRFDPSNLAEVRLYDLNDKYLFSWKCADALMLEYIKEGSKQIGESRRLEKSVTYQIKDRARELKGKKFYITRKDTLNATISKGKQKFIVHLPQNTTMVTIDEPLPMASGGEDINIVSFDINRITSFKKQQKGD